MSKQRRRPRGDDTLAARRRPPEGATVDLYEAIMMYTTASRIIEAYKEDRRSRRPGNRSGQK